MTSKNNVGNGIKAGNANWSFGGDTAKTFTDHVKSSVPFYEAGHEAVIELSDFFVKEDSCCYEIGVSTAALLSKLAQKHKKSVSWNGIDIQKNMIDQAHKEMKDAGTFTKNINLICDDVTRFEFEPSDFIVSYYTNQFIAPRFRQELINNIYNSLNWGGAFILFEKVRAPDSRFQDINTSVYTEFKIKNGYSFDEIVSKTRSLKGVMEPFSSQGNIDMLERSGFKDINTILKWFCFEGFLCIK